MPSSRLAQSTIGSETAMAWIEFGIVRASVVTSAPPMREPRRETLGKSFLVQERRMWLIDIAVSWIGKGKVWDSGERR